MDRELHKLFKKKKASFSINSCDGSANNLGSLCSVCCSLVMTWYHIIGPIFNIMFLYYSCDYSLELRRYQCPLSHVVRWSAGHGFQWPTFFIYMPMYFVHDYSFVKWFFFNSCLVYVYVYIIILMWRDIHVNNLLVIGLELFLRTRKAAFCFFIIRNQSNNLTHYYF